MDETGLDTPPSLFADPPFEVRRIHEGQVIGEEVLLSVSQTWAVTGRCVTPCDVQVLHRRLFYQYVREMESGSGEDERESKRVQELLEGGWKDHRVMLSLPLFRGYDPEFLVSLAKMMETRVVFPGTVVWDGNQARGHEHGERSLYFLLQGLCEETVELSAKVKVMRKSSKSTGKPGAAERELRRTRRQLLPGVCFATGEFLSLDPVTTGRVEEPASQKHSRVKTLEDQVPPPQPVVTARALCLVALLHQSTWIRQVESHPRTLQAPEVSKLLREELDRVEPLPEGHSGARGLLEGLSMLDGCDPEFLDALAAKAVQRFCVKGQRICCAQVETTTLVLVCRGYVTMDMDGVAICTSRRGDHHALNKLALAQGPFAPSYSLVCATPTECWTLSRSDFTACLEAFPAERTRLQAVVEVPLHQVAVAGIGANTNVRSWSWSEMSKDSEKPACDLSQIALFRGCSHKFLSWIQDHLEAVLYHPDDVVVQEGAVSDCMFIVVCGSVLVEGGTSSGSSTSMKSGSTFCERRILEVFNEAAPMATAVEITMLQVLHRKVFQRGVELFPQEQQHFDKVAVGQLNRTSGADFKWAAGVPLFATCSADFVRQVAVYLRTNLVRKGEPLMPERAARETLYILRSGEAIVPGEVAEGEEPDRVPERAVLNADVMLGLARRLGPQASARAETTCTTDSIQASALFSCLRPSPRRSPHSSRRSAPTPRPPTPATS